MVKEGPMVPLTRENVVSVLGPVDEDMIATIVATGATVEELTRAAAWVNNDEALVNDGQPLPSGRVAELIELLSDEEEEDER
jgi:hypothetical protein